MFIEPITESKKNGNKAEFAFERLAKKKGWVVNKAHQQEDMYEHFDYIIFKDGEVHRVEVKSRKRINRHDEIFQDDYIWIELENVRGDKGWLYGTADLIAFEEENDFKLVKREDLVRIVELLVKPEKVESPYKALYRLYNRNNRGDKLTLIRSVDLEKALWEVWSKA